MSRRARRKSKKPSTQSLSENKELTTAFLRLSESLHVAQSNAETLAPRIGKAPKDVIDLREAGRILDQHPQLVSYLQSVKEIQDAQREAMGDGDIYVRSNPTGGGSQGQTIGGWGGFLDKNHPQGVNNAKTLRDFVDQCEWVAAAVNYYTKRISRADLAILPEDERKPYSKPVEKTLTNLLNNPNELGDTIPKILSATVRDYLTIGRGTITKDMNARRVPSSLYVEDASFVKIYSQWTGKPDEPRYLYNPDAQTKIPMRNDEVICVLNGFASFRYSFSPIQILRNTILADIKATESAMRLVDQKPPPHVIQIPGASPSQISTLSTTYQNTIMGRREVLFLGGPNPALVKPMIYSLRDNQWMEWMEYLAMKIFAVLDLAPQDFGMTVQINKATAESQQDISENKGLIPTMLDFESYFNRHLVADFAPRRQGRADLSALNLRMVFPEISEAARMLHVEKAINLAGTSLAGFPSSTINNVLAMMGEPPLPHGGNTFYVMTTNGPMPWLSYDEDRSSADATQGQPTGTQTPEGGIETEQTQEDMGSSDSKESNGNTESNDNQGESPSSNEISNGSETKAYSDTRKPGTRWNAASMQRSRQRVTTKTVAPVIHEDLVARQRLSETIKNIFADVENRGAETLRRSAQ